MGGAASWLVAGLHGYGGLPRVQLTVGFLGHIGRRQASLAWNLRQQPVPRGSSVGALPCGDVMLTVTEGGGGEGSDSDGRWWGRQWAAHPMRRGAGSGGGRGTAPRGSVYNGSGLGFGWVFSIFNFLSQNLFLHTV